MRRSPFSVLWDRARIVLELSLIHIYVKLPDQVDSLATSVEIAEVFSSDYSDIGKHRILGNLAAITTLEGMVNLGFDLSLIHI